MTEHIPHAESEEKSDFVRQTEEFAKQDPTKAVLYALGAGLLTSFLPFRAIASLIIGLALAAVKPALLILGAWKASELYKEKGQS